MDRGSSPLETAYTMGSSAEPGQSAWISASCTEFQTSTAFDSTDSVVTLFMIHDVYAGQVSRSPYKWLLG